VRGALSRFANQRDHARSQAPDRRRNGKRQRVNRAALSQPVAQARSFFATIRQIPKRNAVPRSVVNEYAIDLV
jgi:hypothetical protein